MQREQVDPRQIEFTVTEREEAPKSKMEDKKVMGKKEREKDKRVRQKQ